MDKKINAIKYILSKRHMQQQELSFATYDKRYVSKVINRHFRIRDELISKWESILQVPSKFFVEKETGKCKLLNSNDVRELDSYFDTEYFLEHEKDLQHFAEVEYAVRQHYLSTNITKLQRIIRKDICSVRQSVDSNIAALEIQEANLVFYKNITELHEKNILRNAEWDNILKAFQYVAENVSEEALNDENPLVKGIYVLIKKSRECNDAKQQRDMQDYELLFGSLLTPFDNYYE